MNKILTPEEIYQLIHEGREAEAEAALADRMLWLDETEHAEPVTVSAPVDIAEVMHPETSTPLARIEPVVRSTTGQVPAGVTVSGGIPPLDDCVMIQATYFDNGAPKYPVRQNKADGGKGKNQPQHMVTLLAWTSESIEFYSPDFKTNIILIQHHKFLKRLETWVAKGTISPDYHDVLRREHAKRSTEGKMEQDRLWWGPLHQRQRGERIIPNQFLTLYVETGSVSSGILFVNGQELELSNWSRTYPDQSPLAGNARAFIQCKLR